MSDFKPIETQEQLDEIIKGRLTRERESLSKKYAGYLSPEDHEAKLQEYKASNGELTSKLDEANKKIANHQNELAERDSKIKAYESHSVKTRIASELGLSHKAVDFLKGEDEDSIRKSAESLKSLLGSYNVAPLASNDYLEKSNDAALMNVVKELNKGE